MLEHPTFIKVGEEGELTTAIKFWISVFNQSFIFYLMNLLHVIASMDPTYGGTCQGIRNCIPELEKLGVRNEVVSLDNPDAPFLKKELLTTLALGPGRRPWCYSAKLIPWLRNNLRRFDAVIVHGLWLYHSYAVMKTIQLLKSCQQPGNRINDKIPKFYVMPHGMLDPYFQRAKERKVKAIRNWFYWKFVESNVVNKTDGMLFTCEAELLLAREPFRPYNPKHEVNVGFGIAEPPAFHPSLSNAFLRKCPQLAGSPYILFLSRIHEKKGVDLLIAAYKYVTEKLKESKAELAQAANTGEKTLDNQGRSYEFPKLVVAGPGLDTPYGQYIQKIATESPDLRESVIFPGMLTGDAKWGAFYGCEAFVLPSHQENFGIAVVEALACGKPVMISNQVNIWREIEVAGGGIVVDDTLEQIQQMLERWKTISKKKKIEMGLNARNTFKNYFAIRPAAQKLISTVSSGK
jgi:glycosyltransferase involved in cell wall biosynthesis